MVGRYCIVGWKFNFNLYTLVLKVTHVKISQLVASLKTSRQQLCSHGLLQVVNKFGTSSLLTTLLILSELLQGCSNKAVTITI